MSGTLKLTRGKSVFALGFTADTTFEEFWALVLKAHRGRALPDPRRIAELAWEAGKQVGLDVNY